jgi:GNAT superfamily N-acetyltransferase
VIYRDARKDDVPFIVHMGREFWSQTEYHKAGMLYSKERAAAMAESCIESGIAIVAELGGEIHGFLVGIVAPALFTEGKVFSDIAFYVSPEARHKSVGRDLLLTLKHLAAKRGVEAIAMMNLESVTPEKAEKLYLSTGFKKAESTFVLALP